MYDLHWRQAMVVNVFMAGKLSTALHLLTFCYAQTVLVNKEGEIFCEDDRHGHEIHQKFLSINVQWEK